MRGFKDDFYAWKDSLSKDEQALLLKQAQNEFDKKFRKSDEFSQDLPEEKIQSFAKVLKKFFDNAAEHALKSLRWILQHCKNSPCLPRKRMTTRRPRPGKWAPSYSVSKSLGCLISYCGRLKILINRFGQQTRKPEGSYFQKASSSSSVG